MLHDETIFSFYLGKSEIQGGFSASCEFGEHVLQSDGRTPVSRASADGCEVLIFGYAIDLESGISDGELAKDLLCAAKDVDAMIAREERLGGKYLIFFRSEKGEYVLPDATSSIPLFYASTEAGVVATSHSRVLVDELALSPDDQLLQIRRSGEISQAMPYDLTEYREIRQLLPNHCLSLSSGTVKRFVNAQAPQKKISVEEATERVFPLIECLTRYYTSLFDIHCAITSGRDSRVVLAFLQADAKSAVKTYTIRHKEHKGTEPDLTVPKEIAKVFPMDYEQFADMDVPESLKREVDTVLGEGRYSLRTLLIAHTIKARYGNGAVVNGDIIGQVGKCSLHRDIPAFLATPGYFRCKLHNYSREAKRQLRVWLREIKESGEKVNTFDLFSVENRMGRWAGQGNLVYNTLGQMNLNVFNSRSIIYTWTAVDRGLRKKSALHVALIQKKCPSLLQVPFGADEGRFERIAKANALFYYLASYLKYFIERREFMKGATHE